ncbi:MAG: NADH-quinone oxidoreductase subunit L [Candidatus Aminicenantes bacterium]|nr:NADH-quinone oxidoreductase subunit L [Candidatus Aminicenantes bacterium]
MFVPIVGSLTIPLAGLISAKARSFWSVLLALATTAFSLLLIPFALKGGELTFRKTMALGLDFIIVADALAIFMAIVSSFIGALIVIYSLGYIGHEENQSEYYLIVLLFIGAMMGLVFSANLIFMYLFWEIAAIACWRLIGFYRVKEYVLKADKAFLVTFFGAVFMLLGFILIYNQTGTFDLTAMRGTLIPGTAVLLILMGMFSKSATVPLHTWLPDAGVAPTPVTAILHAAVLVKIGVYAYVRLFCYTFKLPEGWYQAIPIIVVFSSLIAAGAAAVENDIKRILAYSTISQIGYIFLGFSVMNPVGIAGSLLFILMHGLAKAGLFLCAGIVIHATHERDISKMGGMFKTMPWTALAFIFCAFSVIGIPPFGGFFSKFMVIFGAVQAGQIWVAAVALFAALLTIFYLFRVFSAVFMGEAKSDKREGSRSMVLVVVVLAILSLLAGFFVAYPMKLVNIATVEILRWMQ